MARSNPNADVASQPKLNTTCRSLFETGTEEPELEPNLLYIVNTLLALKKTRDVTAWLASNEHNAGKLIMFVNVVCNKYDKLATENNNFVKNNKKLLASETPKNGVIQFLKNQHKRLQADNNTLRKMQEHNAGPTTSLEAAANPRVDQVVNNGIQHQSSLGPSDNATTSTASKRRFKLDNLNRFTGERDSIPIEQWLTQMEGKITEDEELIDTPRRRIVYVLNCLDGRAFKHVEPRARKNASKPWKNLDKMFAHLERVFGDSNRLKNAENKNQNLRQGNKNFNTF